MAAGTKRYAEVAHLHNRLQGGNKMVSRIALDLKEVRRTAGKSLRDVATALGYSEKNGRITVAQMEARKDWLVSSIDAYLRALGASGELEVFVAGKRLRYRIGLSPQDRAQSFLHEWAERDGEHLLR